MKNSKVIYKESYCNALEDNSPKDPKDSIVCCKLSVMVERAKSKKEKKKNIRK